jgi:hypothetical protein
LPQIEDILGSLEVALKHFQRIADLIDSPLAIWCGQRQLSSGRQAAALSQQRGEDSMERAVIELTLHEVAKGIGQYRSQDIEPVLVGGVRGGMV